MTSSTQPQCCQECLIPEHDTTGEDYRGAVPDACSDEGCPCHQPRQEWEELAAQVHHIYCVQYEKDRGTPYWTEGDYNKLDERTKQYDRNIVDWHLKILASERKALLEELLREIKDNEKDQQVAQTLGNDETIYVGGYNKGLSAFKSLIEKKLKGDK